MSQNTKEQTVSGRKLISRSNDDARSSIMFIEFGSVEVNSELSQVNLVESWGQEPDHSEVEERNKDTETATIDDSSEKLAVNGKSGWRRMQNSGKEVYMYVFISHEGGINTKDERLLIDTSQILNERGNST